MICFGCWTDSSTRHIKQKGDYKQVSPYDGIIAEADALLMAHLGNAYPSNRHVLPCTFVDCETL